jgi:hypothetical protein
MTISDAAASPEDLDEPSGAWPRLSRRTWGLVVLGLAALVAIASYVGFLMADQPVRWRNVGYEVESPTSASVTYDVFLYTDDDAVCYLRALNIRFAEVGAATVTVLRVDGPQQRLTHQLVTTETANTAIVESCVPAP